MCAAVSAAIILWTVARTACRREKINHTPKKRFYAISKLLYSNIFKTSHVINVIEEVDFTIGKKFNKNRFKREMTLMK